MKMPRQVLRDCGVTAKGEPIARIAWHHLASVFSNVDPADAWDVASMVKRLVDSKAAEVERRRAKP